ncbi:DMT family transporter [Mycolicibacterium brisbanense]
MLHIAMRDRLPSGPELALIGVTAIWGSTFPIVHQAMNHSGPLFFVGLRFVIAGVLGAAVFYKTLRGVSVAEVVAGVAIGAAIACGYGLQTYGLQSISSSVSAFITALYVPLVPLLQWAVMRRRPDRAALVGVLLAFVGLVLLAGPSATGLSLGRGELATLMGAVAMAAEILLISGFAGKVDLGRVTVIQLLAAGAFALLAMPVTGETVPAFSWWWFGAAVGMGVSSCLIQATMNWAQRSVSPTRATIIYAGEPVWGGIFGRVAGDRLPGLAIVGAIFIVAGVIVSELKPRSRRDEAVRTEEIACATAGQA